MITVKDLTKAVHEFKGDYYNEKFDGEYHVFQKLVDFPEQAVVVPELDAALKYESIVQGEMDFATGTQKQELRFSIGEQTFSIERVVSEDDVEEYRLGTLTEVTQS